MAPSPPQACQQHSQNNFTLHAHCEALKTYSRTHVLPAGVADCISEIPHLPSSGPETCSGARTPSHMQIGTHSANIRTARPHTAGVNSKSRPFLRPVCLSGSFRLNSRVSIPFECSIAVVEEMYSLRHAYETTGDITLFDRLEFVAFNSMPVTTDRYWTGNSHYHAVNQIRASGTLGYNPFNGCCTGNVHQGWYAKITSQLISPLAYYRYVSIQRLDGWGRNGQKLRMEMDVVLLLAWMRDVFAFI